MADPENTTPEGDESPDDLARSLGMTEDAVRGRGAGGGGDGMPDAGPIELDKDGALVGRKKLTPKKALQEDGDESIPDEPEASAPADSGKPKKAALPPKLSLLRPPELEADASQAEGPDADDPFAEMVEVPAGSFLFGEAGESRGVPAFRIDRYPVTNRQYERFVRATGHRHPLYWAAGHLPDELAEHPVVGVDYFDALAYAAWCGKDLPFEDEWERAARGTDGRTFPWGEETDLSGANTARVGIKCTTPVDAYPQNVSPAGIADVVGNCWEITHSPAPGGGIVVRGGSWYDFALYAKTWFRFAARTDARNGTIGFRCVIREDAREDAAREVDPTQAEAEMIARTGPQPPVDRTAWDAEKRDLVPDYPRLRSLIADIEAERLAERPVPHAPDAPEPPPTLEAGESPLTPREDHTTPEPEPEPVLAAEATVTEPDPEPDAEPEEAVAEADAAEADAAEEPAEPERLHVHAVDPPERRSASSRDSGAVERVAEEVVQAETIARAEEADAPPPRTSKMMWGLLLLGFVLVGAVAVAIINKQSATKDKPPRERPTTPGTAPADHLARLPDVPGNDGAHDVLPLRLLDATDEDTQEQLAQGNWLLVFADPESDGGLATIQSAHNISLRMISSGTRVAIVLPRAAYEEEGGGLPGPVVLEQRVQEGWTLQGATVILDIADGPMSLRKRHLESAPGIAAVVTHEGRLEMKAWAPKPTRQFSVHTLAPIAAEAHALSPVRAPEDGD